MSVYLNDFSIISNAIHNISKDNKNELNAVLFLPGSQKTIKLDHVVKELVNCFKNIPKNEQLKVKTVLKERLIEVRDSPLFNTNNKSYAKLNLKLISTNDNRFDQTQNIQSIIKIGLEVFDTLTFPIDPEAEPEKSEHILNENAPLNSSVYEEGKFIDQQWDDKHGHFAKESIERRDTIESLKQNAINQLNYVQTRMKNESLTPIQRGELKQTASRLQATINKCNSSSVSWANSDYFRNILRGDAKLDSTKNEQGIRGAIEAYESKINNEYYLIAPVVNMRYHTCRVGQQIDGWLRLGVISDMSNGFVNLDSLNILNKSLSNNDLATANALRMDMAKEVISVWSKALKANNKKIDATAGFALKQLGFSIKEIVDLKAQLVTKTPINLSKLTITKEKLPRFQETLKKTIAVRSEVMNKQFLQMVADHATRINSNDVDAHTFKMLHVSLLNPSNKSVDGSGWYHNENNEILDMATLFEQFDGKKLISDSKGPFIDSNGDIHVPPSASFPENKEMVIRPVFINQSVQGHTKNDGTQKKISDRAFAKLQALGIAGSYKEILSSPKTGYTSAANAVNLAIQLGFKASTGCLSAKDRTGFVSALLSERTMRRAKFSKSLRESILRDQLKKHSPAVRVVIDNTGTSVMKITPFRIEGITKGTKNFRSFIARSITYVRQITEILKERKRIKQLERT